jgi:hypothetical protein
MGDKWISRYFPEGGQSRLRREELVWTWEQRSSLRMSQADDRRSELRSGVGHNDLFLNTRQGGRVIFSVNKRRT